MKRGMPIFKKAGFTVERVEDIPRTAVYFSSKAETPAATTKVVYNVEW